MSLMKLSKSIPQNLNYSERNHILPKNDTQKSGNSPKRYPKSGSSPKKVPKIMAHPLIATYASYPLPPPPPPPPPRVKSPADTIGTRFFNKRKARDGQKRQRLLEFNVFQSMKWSMVRFVNFSPTEERAY